MTIQQETDAYNALLELNKQALRLHVVASCYSDHESLSNRLKDIAHEVEQAIKTIKSAALKQEAV